MAAQRPSSLVSITRAGLTVAVALGLTRVFAERGVARRRARRRDRAARPASRGPIAAAVACGHPRSRAVLGGRRCLAHALVVDPRHTVARLPDAARPSAATATISATRRTCCAPRSCRSSPTGRALLLALVALCVAGAIAEWSARRFDAPLGAIGPSLVLFVVDRRARRGRLGVGTRSSTRSPWRCTSLALAQAELTERRTWFHGRGRSRGRACSQAGCSPRVVVVLAARCRRPRCCRARGSAPGSTTATLGDGGEGGGLARSATTPIVSIRAKLLDDPEHEVFTVDIGDELPGVLARDRARRVRRQRSGRSTRRRVSQPTSSQPPTEPPPMRRARASSSRSRDADPHWLPAAYHPVEINLENASCVPDSATLFLEARCATRRPRVRGDSEVPNLDRRGAARGTACRPDASSDAYLDAAAPTSRSVSRRSPRRSPQDASTPWEQAAATRATSSSRRRVHVQRRTSLGRTRSTALEEFLFDDAERLLRAVRGGVRGDGPFGRPADAGRGRLPVRHARKTACGTCSNTRRARLARGVLRRASAGSRSSRHPGAARTTPAAPATATAAARRAAPKRRPRRRRRPPTTPGGPTPRVGRADPRTATRTTSTRGGDAASSTRNDELVRPVLRRVSRLRSLRSCSLGAASRSLVLVASRRGARGGAATRRSARDRVLGAWARGARPSRRRGRRAPNRRRRRSSSRCGTRPRTARATPGPPLMELAQLQTAALFAPDPPTDRRRRRARGSRSTRSTRAVAHSVSRSYPLAPPPRPAAASRATCRADASTPDVGLDCAAAAGVDERGALARRTRAPRPRPRPRAGRRRRTARAARPAARRGSGRRRGRPTRCGRR